MDTGRTLQLRTETRIDCLEQCFADEQTGDYKRLESLTREYCYFTPCTCGTDELLQYKFPQQRFK